MKRQTTEFSKDENKFFSQLNVDPRKAASAGLIMYDIIDGEVKILLVHPGGPFYVKKDLKHWGIPKGLIEGKECEWECAKREFEEETGITPPISKSKYFDLGTVTYKSGKVVHAWLFRGNFPGAITCNLFSMEWPPNSGNLQEFPENDRGEMFTITEAMDKIMSSQEQFIVRVDKIVRNFLS